MRGGTSALNVLGPEPSLRLMSRLGGRFGALGINRARLARAEENIAWCFPGWERERCRDLALESYRHLFCLAAELSMAHRRMTSDGYASFVRLGEVGPGLDALLGGEPCVLITGHCGNWELLGATLAALGFPLHALYRPLDMKPLDRWVQRTRSRGGLTLVDKFGASSSLPGIMERGDPAAFIADQNAGDGGLFVPFFNRLASAYKSIGLMAMKYRAPVVCGRATREFGVAGRRYGYVIEITDVIRPESWEGRPDPLYYITARYRRAIERMVRAAPEQYLWMHRYWKSRPRHERLGRAFPGALRAKIESLPWMSGADVEAVVERSSRDASDWASGALRRR